MLARQAWRILNDPTSLSARVLKAIYFPNGDLLDAHLGNAPSQVWRAIHEGIGILKQGLIRRIGDGRTTGVWEQNWVPRDDIMRPITARGRNKQIWVSELIDRTEACWKLDVLNTIFLPMDAQAIMKIPLSSVRQDDRWAWHHERNGIFSVRSAYRMLITTKKVREDWLDHRSAGPNYASDEKNWSLLWKTKVPSKVHVFAWRLAYNSLPAAQVLHHRNMAATPICQICNAASDSWRHSLIDCNMVRCVWALVDEEITEHMSMNETPDAQLWLFAMRDSLDHSSFVKMLVTLWAVWTARRKAIHEDQFQSPFSTYEFVKRFLSELGEAYQVKPKQTQVPVQVSRQRRCSTLWLKPPEGMVKINVDGAVARDESHGAVSAVCRDANGVFLGASARTINGVSDPATLEAMACAEALSLAEDIGVTKLMVSTDCLEVIKRMMEDNLCPYSAILSEIVIRSSKFELVNFRHESRDYNGDAHLVARNSLSQPSGRRLWLLGPPVDVSPVATAE